jgi:hypothetical protein
MRKFAVACFALIACTGCSQSQDIGQDLANCKKEAIELVRSSGGDTETSVTPTLHHLDECMKAKGYSATLICASSAARLGLPLCWEPIPSR